jgi:hypothetical protein
MAIGVKTDSENDCLLVPFFSHYCKINSLPGSSSGKKPPAWAQAIFRPFFIFSRGPFSLQPRTPNAFGVDFLKQLELNHIALEKTVKYSVF